MSLDFFKVLVPLLVALKILSELDWIRYLALPLEPIMHLLGLPPDLGIAWATGLMVNFYSALIVFV
ncbi:MAG: nucleoside recognition domain-containing protein, partial [Bilophila sp.]